MEGNLSSAEHAVRSDPSMTVAQWDQLVQAARNSAQLGELFAQHRDRLKRIVAASLDHRARGRMDASDVIQETFLEAFARINEYLQTPSVSIFVWLRFLVKQRLAMMHRQHLHVQARDARRDRPLPWAEAIRRSSSVMLAAELAARLTTASAAFNRQELKREIQAALALLDEKSREMLVLRHFEQLSNIECAQVLEISTTAACNRYIRALERLKGLLPSGPEVGP